MLGGWPENWDPASVEIASYKSPRHIAPPMSGGATGEWRRNGNVDKTNEALAIASKVVMRPRAMRRMHGVCDGGSKPNAFGCGK